MSQPPAELAEHVQPSRGGDDDINSKYFDKTNGIKTVLSSPVLGFYLLLTVGYFTQSWIKESQLKWLRLLLGKQPKNHKLLTDNY